MSMRNVLGIVILIFSISCSESDLLVDRKFNNEVIHSSLKSDSVLLLNSNCGNRCLPEVNVYHSPGGTEISWNSSLNGKECNSFFLSCSGAGQYRSGYVNESSSWFFSHEETAYTFTYMLTCKSGCSSCSDRKSFVKKSDEPDGSLSTFTDCQKEYLNYRVEITGGNTFLIYNQSSLDEQANTEHFLTVDSYKIYKMKNGSSIQLLSEGSIYPNLMINEVAIPGVDPWDHCEIRLYSSFCKYSEDHYLYNEFFYDGLNTLLSSINTQTVRMHFN